MNEQQILEVIQAALDSESGQLDGSSDLTAAGKRVIGKITESARDEIEAASADGVADVQG